MLTINSDNKMSSSMAFVWAVLSLLPVHVLLWWFVMCLSPHLPSPHTGDCDGELSFIPCFLLYFFLLPLILVLSEKISCFPYLASYLCPSFSSCLFRFDYCLCSSLLLMLCLFVPPFFCLVSMSFVIGCRLKPHLHICDVRCDRNGVEAIRFCITT